MTITMPASVKAYAETMHEQVALIRKGADLMGVDLSDFTDIETLSLQHWCQANTPPGLDAAKTMVGLIHTMKGDTTP